MNSTSIIQAMEDWLDELNVRKGDAPEGRGDSHVIPKVMDRLKVNFIRRSKIKIVADLAVDKHT